MTEHLTLDDLFAGSPLMVILRGLGVAQSLKLSARAWDIGIDVVELPIQNKEDVDSLRAVVRAGRDRGKLVGAGTITRIEQLETVTSAEAAFTVCPGFDIDVVRASERAGVPCLPGVSTPTEVQLADKEGLSWLKAFPASSLGTSWFTAMKGPFPQMKLVATGGIDSSNAGSFLNAGARVVAVGSALSDPEQLPLLAAISNRAGRMKDRDV